MKTRIPYFKGLTEGLRGKLVEVEGFYFEMPKTTYCFQEDQEDVETLVYLVDYTMTDWGLPNQPRLYKVKKDSLEFVKYVDVEVKAN